MLRGVNKQIIEINNTGNQYFERILLFVNPSCSELTDGKLEREARRLVDLYAQDGPPGADRTACERRDASKWRRGAIVTAVLFGAGLLLRLLFLFI